MSAQRNVTLVKREASAIWHIVRHDGRAVCGLAVKGTTLTDVDLSRDKRRVCANCDQWKNADTVRLA